MHTSLRWWRTAAALVFALSTSHSLGDDAKQSHAFAFRDVGDETGLFPAAAGIRGHGVAWGDSTGSGFPDLFVATFHNAGSKPGLFFRNEKGKFRLDDQEHLRTSGNGSGALFVDLTNTGKLDLYVSNCAHAAKEESRTLPSLLFRNEGQGKFTDISKASGACPPMYAGRGVSAIDFDGDSKLDLLTCERYYGSVKLGTMLLQNQGDYRFENVAQNRGLPLAFSGLAVAVADVNGDGWPDLFLSAGDGNHRLYLNDAKGNYTECPGTREVFQWKGLGKDDTPAGVCIADLNRDGLPDIVVGHHPKAPWRSPMSIRMVLNRGVKAGIPRFEDITEAAGLKPLTMKAPHVEIQDFDNDGWPDLFLSVVKFKDGQAHPLVYKGIGVKDGVPRFSEDVWAINEFPTKEDLAVKGTVPFADKMRKDKKIVYMAAASSCDYDRDGRLDLFLADWYIDSRSLLLRNETPARNWLDVRVEGTKHVNRMGIGSVVKLFSSGGIGDASKLIGCREIQAGFGYCAGQEAIAHFGLDRAESVDIEVTLPHGRGKINRVNVRANQRLTLSEAN